MALGNVAVSGAKSTSIGANALGGREGTITIGANANNGAVYATIVGTDSSINYESRNSGAVSTVIGSKNNIKNDDKMYSGVASSILGAANTIENSNGVTIQGTGNTVTGAYKNMNLSISDLLKLYRGDYSVLAEKENGAIAIIGGANTISSQTSSTVIGFGNTLKGENSTGVFTAGSHNKLTNVSNSLVMGDHNTLVGRKNVISLGNNNTVGADDAVAIGNGTTVKAESGVAIGVGSVADRVAESEKGALGAFAPDTIPTGQESTWTSTKGAVSVGDTANNITRQITNVAAGREDTDAVNVAQLKQVASQAERANQGWNLTTNGVDAAATNVAPGGSVDFSGDDNVTVSNQDTKVKVSLNKDINVNSVQTNALNSKYNLSVGTAAADGKMPFFVNSNGAFSAAGSKFVVDKDGSVKATSGDIGNVKLNDGVFYKNSALRDGELYVGDADVNYSQITSKNAKLGKVKIDDTGRISGVAAGRIAADSTDAINGSQLHAVQQEAGKHTKVVNGSNVTVEETDQDGQKTYKVGLNKDLLLGDITGKNVSISGTNGTIETTGSIATKDKIYADKGAKLADIDITGDTISNGQSSVKLDKEGTVTINGKVSVNQDGKVSGVAAGDISEKSTDAVNGSQLFATTQQVVQPAQSISKLGNRINKVGAGAAALAALHPLDFDPDDKWDIAAGYGNYNGENAAAIGAYYRPNEDTMFSVGGSFGNGENMVNAGVSLKLGQGNHVSTSKVAMAKEIKDLRKELEGLKSALLDVNAGKKLDTSKLQLFPDVPKNHWAYEYVSTLKGNGALTGYPDGEFKGDRPMTRYEFATMLYKAMLEGATLSDKILKEFEPELERFTVDTVHQDKDGKPTVERVRTVKAKK